jgi:hypothetical protein
MRADGSHVRQPTQRHPRANGTTGEDAEPQFSPDGMTLLGKLAGHKIGDAIGATADWDLGLRRYAERLAT